MAFASYGLGEYDGINWVMYKTTNSNIPTDSLICEDFDASGNLWIGSKEGAILKTGSNFNVYFGNKRWKQN